MRAKTTLNLKKEISKRKETNKMEARWKHNEEAPGDIKNGWKGYMGKINNSFLETIETAVRQCKHTVGKKEKENQYKNKTDDGKKRELKNKNNVDINIIFETKEKSICVPFCRHNDRKSLRFDIVIEYVNNIMANHT